MIGFHFNPHLLNLTPLCCMFIVSIPLKVETSIVVTGNSNPADAIIYNDTHIQSQVGPSVEHK